MKHAVRKEKSEPALSCIVKVQAARCEPNLTSIHYYVTCLPALVVYMKIYVHGTLAYVNIGRNET